ncbi:M23 family metallopeptidase [Microbacterium thalassium]|uniref:Murein DD-endopeptidase MepM/ murein hydrolase activator NlpD n=1 Tax=Microbacterium thalassium TaxID=362649 RepID=A0A7X0KTD4_9MICO|nr:M23 family metallopeptidase [Microbacterium thalassium]MBB6389972.1 murein DD-endopeptidase MepM/ murein hydrolase activator NlpD [Microbacterium thalassium]GLK24658.1 hypothetical protein GCM10017607_19760 [Microbacterium thalassium]
MGAPVAAAAALANSKSGRRIAIGIVAVIAVVVMTVLAPLIAVPLAVAGSQTSTELTSGEAGVGAAAASGEWGYPLAGAYTKGRGFGFNPVAGCAYCSTDHQGYDMAQGCGSTIYAAGPGEVITAGNYQGYGNAVRIDHGEGLVTLYGHMQWGSLRVVVGQQVTAGTPVGAEGNTGKSFGCHLHFEVLKSGTSVDPEPFMSALGLPLT